MIEPSLFEFSSLFLPQMTWPFLDSHQRSREKITTEHSWSLENIIRPFLRHLAEWGQEFWQQHYDASLLLTAGLFVGR
jgi:hypothetical protein